MWRTFFKIGTISLFLGILNFLTQTKLIFDQVDFGFRDLFYLVLFGVGIVINFSTDHYLTNFYTILSTSRYARVSRVDFADIFLPGTLIAFLVGIYFLSMFDFWHGLIFLLFFLTLPLLQWFNQSAIQFGNVFRGHGFVITLSSSFLCYALFVRNPTAEDLVYIYMLAIFVAFAVHFDKARHFEFSVSLAEVTSRKCFNICKYIASCAVRISPTSFYITILSLVLASYFPGVLARFGFFYSIISVLSVLIGHNLVLSLLSSGNAGNVALMLRRNHAIYLLLFGWFAGYFLFLFCIDFGLYLVGCLFDLSRFVDIIEFYNFNHVSIILSLLGFIFFNIFRAAIIAESNPIVLFHSSMMGLLLFSTLLFIAVIFNSQMLALLSLPVGLCACCCSIALSFSNRSRM